MKRKIYNYISNLYFIFSSIPIIKNKTRIIEKNNLNYESKISLLEKNLLEAN